LINPHHPNSRMQLASIPGTRIVQETLGIVGSRFIDPLNPVRIWTINGIYAPLRRRAIGGIRAKLVDQKGFVTFCNQRDLEVLLDVASPGGWCAWLEQDYAGVRDRNWIGMCVDEDDLTDDLFDRELSIRAQISDGVPIPAGVEITRRIHGGPDNDFEELLVLLWDGDAETGWSPDDRFETVDRRWKSIDRTSIRLREKLWNTITNSK